MHTYIIIAIILSIVAAICLMLYVVLIKKVKELKIKTKFSVSADDLMKITFEGQKTLKSIVRDFNTLVGKYQDIKNESHSLHKSKKEKDELDTKLVEFEHYMSQSNMLAKIGKRITSSLNINEIVGIVFEYVRSSMDIEELELLVYEEEEKPILMSIGNKADGVMIHKSDTMESSVFKWTLENKKEVFLNNAKEDYSQYFYEPISSFSGKSPGALIGVPLFLNEKVIGAVGVFSMNKDVYSEYQVEFLKTLATYLAVALDNSNVYKLLENTKLEIEKEKSKSDKLLLNILPAEIAEELKENGEAKARHFDNVAILFSDFKEFTIAASKLSPTELVSEINVCFKEFDIICEKYNVEKIKTIGDSFMAVGGLPVPYDEYIHNTVKAGIEMADFVVERKRQQGKDAKVIFDMRLGIHIGPVVAGIVGVRKFQYDLWGDTVNTASRMESYGQIEKVNISSEVYDVIKNDPSFSFESRGKIHVRGKGEIEMYFVTNKA